MREMNYKFQPWRKKNNNVIDIVQVRDYRDLVQEKRRMGEYEQSVGEEGQGIRVGEM